MQKTNPKQPVHISTTSRFNYYRGGGGRHYQRDMDGSFKKQLSDLGLEIKQMLGDGNCLFRSFADQLDNDPARHLKYRKASVKYMRKFSADFSEFLSEEDLAEDFEQYLNRMSESGQYGGHLQIQALSRSINLKLFVHELDKPPFIVTNNKGKSTNSLIINLAYYPGRRHYESIMSINVPEFVGNDIITHDKKLTQEKVNLKKGLF